MNWTVLSQYGIQWEKGVRRCMGDRDLYKMVLDLFMKDETITHARAAWDARDYQALFRCAHELKGAAGNAELTELYEASSQLVELLRHGDAEEAQVARMYMPMEKAYVAAKEAIALANR